MRVSLNQVKQFNNVDLPPVDELVELINRQLGGVEDIVDLGAKYRDAIIVRVVESSQHPNADRLSVTRVDDGGVVDGLDRDDQGYVQVVCGAPNVQAGMMAIWLPPGGTVPETFAADEPFVLAPKELRGVISNGMLASARELDLGDDHDGIIELTQADLPAGSAQLEQLIGSSFAEQFGLDDIIIDIENKMFTHRPDLFGQLGVAREIAAITSPLPAADQPEDIRYENPDWYWSIPGFAEAEGLTLTAFNDVPDIARRFMAVAIDGIKVGPSPLWLQCALVAMGTKPINTVVDWTNYIMLLTAQPVHAYDYRKLRGQTLGVRLARDGESIKLINGKTYQLSSADMVIADGEGPIGLAGVMGGFDSEVTADTTSIVLEVANFDMYQVRKTSMRHGLFTDAVTRFSKGQSYLQTDHVLSRLMTLIDGNQASQVHDLHQAELGSDGQPTVHSPLNLSPAFVSERLGYEFSGDLIANMLRRVNFAVYPSAEDATKLTVTAPFWRTDIELPEDIVEEVGRLYGFDNLPRTLPRRSIKPAMTSQRRGLKRAVRHSLARAGANELLTYSFVPGKLIEAAQQPVSQAYQIANALSPELEYYRLSLVPSLLEKVYGNIRAGYDELALFEIGKTHSKQQQLTDGEISEPEAVAIVYANVESSGDAAYYHVKRLVEQLFDDLNIQAQAVAIDQLPDGQSLAYFDPQRSARFVTDTGQEIGIVGELVASVRTALKLPARTAAASLSVDGLVNATEAASRYQPLSRFPGSQRDICFQVDQSVSYGQLEQAAREAIAGIDYEATLRPIDIYQAATEPTKNITVRIAVNSHQQTLTSQQVSQVVDQVIDHVTAMVGGRVV